MMPIRINPIRTLAAASILELFLLLGSATLLISNEVRRRTSRLRLNRRLAGWLARALDLRITLEPRETRPSGSWGRLILANHLSILDVIALASLEDAVFVTSREMEESPVIGHLARIGGAAFVERRSRDRRGEELETLRALLREGRTIVLFPEATSGDGTEILRFRNGLLQAVRDLPRVEIVPICLQYLTIGGRPIDRTNRERIYLFGEMSVARHLWNLFTNPEVQLEIRYLAPFFAHECTTPVDVAERAERSVRECFNPIRA
jgi:1-acyl-sn-glycerol-3-phosphate acyltransferase